MTLKKIITTYLDVTNDCIASWSCCGNYWFHFVWPVVNFQVALILLMSIIIPMLVSATMIACPDKTSGSISSSSSSRMNWVSLEAHSSVVHQSDHASSQQHHKLPSGEWPHKYLPRQKRGKQVTPPSGLYSLAFKSLLRQLMKVKSANHRVLYIQCHLVIEVLCQDLCNDQVCRG